MLFGVFYRHSIGAPSIRGYAAKAYLATVLQDQGDGIRQTRTAFLGCSALTVGPRNLRAVTDVPVAFPLNYGGKLVVHAFLSFSLFSLSC
jgi:hypothetical protein